MAPLYKSFMLLENVGVFTRMRMFTVCRLNSFAPVRNSPFVEDRLIVIVKAGLYRSEGDRLKCEAVGANDATQLNA